MNKYRNITLITLAFLFLLGPSMAQHRADSVLSYRNGKDSIRIIFKGNRAYKELHYYPDGKIKSSVITVKDRSRKGIAHRKVISVYTKWNEEGVVTKKERVKMKNFDMGGKDVTWIYVENGKRCLKRNVETKGTKF